MKFWFNSFFVIALGFSIASCNDTEDPNAQTNSEIKAIDNYLQANNTDYVAYDATGMRVVIKEFGSDAPPHAGQTVKATYTAKLFSNGTVFDSGDLTQLIDDVDNTYNVGLQRGLASMLKGAHAVLYIPSKYAFGSTGRTGVPANATVVYDVTLTDVIRTSTEQTRFEADTAAIQDYLDTNNITATKLPNGVFYSITAQGTGDSPKPYDVVSFGYNGKLMSNGASFDQGTVTQQGIFLLIDGLKLGMPLMKEGGSAKFYIPSGYAYGPNGVEGHVGANANLIFEIDLTDIVK